MTLEMIPDLSPCWRAPCFPNIDWKQRQDSLHSMEEQAVAIAALGALKAWTSGATSSPSIHPEVRLFLNDNKCNILASVSSLPPARSMSVVHVQILSVGLKNAAQAKVLVDGRGGFLVFLHTEGRWQCISGAILSNLTMKYSPITPKDIMDVTSMVWDGYCNANCSCQGDLMKAYFHEKCRLTFVDDSGALRIMDCDSFCHMVTHRYTMDLHKPYAHLKDNVGEKTSLISIDFATPDLAMVMLKVGHPPFLWTDLLTCMKIDSKWWIVHKSSCHEDFFHGDESN